MAGSRTCQSPAPGIIKMQCPWRFVHGSDLTLLYNVDTRASILLDQTFGWFWCNSGKGRGCKRINWNVTAVDESMPTRSSKLYNSTPGRNLLKNRLRLTDQRLGMDYRKTKPSVSSSEEQITSRGQTLSHSRRIHLCNAFTWSGSCHRVF